MHSNKKLAWVVLVVVLLAATLFCPTRRSGAPAPASPVAPLPSWTAAAPELPAVEQLTQVLVAPREGVAASELQALGQEIGLSFHVNSPYSEGYLVASVPPGKVQETVDRLARDARVAFAEPNFYMAGAWDRHDVYPLSEIRKRLPSSARTTPNDPLYKYQWHMHKIDVEKAWVSTMGSGAVVAIIDTGVAYENYGKFKQVEDLRGTRFVKGYNFVSGNEHANDDHGHGTHVAGTVAQTTNNGIGVVGVAPKALLMPLKVLSARGTGTVSDIADAIRFAANKGAKVINMSLGGPMNSRVLQSAVEYAHKKGVVIVCAAGNSNSDNVSFPARLPQCIAVSATRFDDQLTFYTNRGKRIDIAAPGGDMNVDQNGDGYMDGVLQNTIVIMDPTQEAYSLFQGTSMAAPHVAGAAALLVSLGITNNEAVREQLKATARRKGLPDELEKGYGGGVLDVGKAVYQSSFQEPLHRMLLALVLLAGLYALSPVKPRPTPWMAALLVMGSSGLFFLPYLGVRLPVLGLLSEPIPDWDVVLAGVTTHANALFWSALIPLVFAVCTFGEKRLQPAAIGLCIGVAAFLIFETFHTTALVGAIPGWLLNKAWLLANAGISLFLAYVLAVGSSERWRKQAEDLD